MARLIKIGKTDSKICASCEFWDGGTVFLKQKGYSNSPETMELSDEARTTYAVCLKKHSKKNGTNRACSNYKLHYSLNRYIE